MKTGQVDLFTKRVRKLPLVKERPTHIAVADTLAVGIMPGWLWTHYPSGEARSEATGALLKRMGTKPGWSDFLLVKPGNGQLHALELKRKGQKPSESQSVFLKELEKAGGMSAWVDNYDDAITILKHWGAISDRLRL